MGMPGWCYLANLCNSTVIEIYGDIIQVSHGFDGCQMLEYIAEISTGHQRNGNDDITGFLASNFFRFGEICTFERVLSNISNIGND
jgi:hypothetical protein